MAGKYVINRSDEQYYFVLEAGNGEIIATSERYATKDAAERGIEAVRNNAPDATIEDVTEEPTEVFA